VSQAIFVPILHGKLLKVLQAIPFFAYVRDKSRVAAVVNDLQAANLNANVDGLDGDLVLILKEVLHVGETCRHLFHGGRETAAANVCVEFEVRNKGLVASRGGAKGSVSRERVERTDPLSSQEPGPEAATPAFHPDPPRRRRCWPS
jgi:hypothetical protein